MDINAIPVVKELSHLPIIADPSHGTGNGSMSMPLPVPLSQREPMADYRGSPDPEHAASDGPQSLKPEVLMS